jgi:hypothetical protein
MKNPNVNSLNMEITNEIALYTKNINENALYMKNTNENAFYTKKKRMRKHSL